MAAGTASRASKWRKRTPTHSMKLTGPSPHEWRYETGFETGTEQSTGSHPGLLGHQDLGDDARRVRRGHRNDDAEWGYLAGVALFAVALVALVAAQICAKRFHPVLYWATIVASTTFGTTLADFADRSLGIGYTGGSLLLLCCVLATLGLWHWSAGTVSVNTVSAPKVEVFYWATITFSQTLGTALGDWLADTGGIGYERGALVFTAGLIVVAALYFWTSASRVTLFWVAFILTRPLGATVGDFLDKPVSNGGLDVSRPLASAVIAALIVAAIIVLPQRPGRHPGEKEGRTAVGAEWVGLDDPQPTDGVLPNQDAPMGGSGGLR